MVPRVAVEPRHTGETGAWRLDISWSDEATLGARTSRPQSWPKATAAAFGRSGAGETPALPAWPRQTHAWCRVGMFRGGSVFWTAATCRRFPRARRVADPKRPRTAALQGTVLSAQQSEVSSSFRVDQQRSAWFRQRGRHHHWRRRNRTAGWL